MENHHYPFSIRKNYGKSPFSRRTSASSLQIQLSTPQRPTAHRAPPSRRSPRTVAPSRPRCRRERRRERRRSAMAGGPGPCWSHGGFIKEFIRIFMGFYKDSMRF